MKFTELPSFESFAETLDRYQTPHMKRVRECPADALGVLSGREQSLRAVMDVLISHVDSLDYDALAALAAALAAASESISVPNELAVEGYRGE